MKKTKQKVLPCANCGKVKAIRARGLCNGCYHPGARVCLNCGQKKPHKSLGLCDPCYQYQSKHDRPRPVRFFDPNYKSTCKNCGEARIIEAKGLCRTCYSYQLRVGRPRPARLINLTRKPKSQFCENCGKVKHINARRLCWACSQYQKIRGIPRPARLWTERRGCKKKCDCGEEATRMVKITIRKRTRTALNLCESCYSLEMEMSH